MSSDFDHQETTWVYDCTDQTAELYTTSRRLWLRALGRNPNFKYAQDLKPGYRIVWPIDQVRVPEMAVNPVPGGKEKALRYMTPQEVASRQATGERLRAAQSKGT